MPIARRRLLLISMLLLSLIWAASSVEASDGMRGDKCIVSQDQRIIDDFYFFCRIVEIHGTIEGDLIGAASEITIESTGVVTGDVWAGGGKLEVRGQVGDDVHFAGITAIVYESAHFSNPRIDVAAVAINTELRAGVVLPGDLLVRGYQARVLGTVGGDVDFAGEALQIDGVVVGGVDASVGDARRRPDVPHLPVYDLSFDNPGLWIAEDALVGRDVQYKSSTVSLIPPDTVQGRVIFNKTGGPSDITKVGQADAAARLLWDYFIDSLRDFLTIMILGVVGLYTVPNVIKRPALHVRRRAISTVGWGLITFMLSVPILIIVMGIGLILVALLYLIKLNGLTLMLGILVLIVTGMLAGGFSFLLFFMGRIVISFVIGQLIYRYAFHASGVGTMRRWITTLALGTAVFVLATNAPVPALGLIIELISALAGIGAVIMYGRDLLYRSSLLTIMPRLAAPRSPLALPAPALVDEPIMGPGMDNLPDGFRGFE
ncbi:MAG: polymer-forming cytoskeletal protein [Anaerolineae bacterium]|nr:polymer-forming cytoskeletal protein [Anaerolineae bacterium]